MFQAGADWIYGIAAIMLFGTVALQAAPEGTYQKYVRLFLGVLMILAVLSPLFSLLGLSETTRLSSEKGILTSWLNSSSLVGEEWQAEVQQKQGIWLREPLTALTQEYGFVCTDYSVQWNEEGNWPQQLTLWLTRSAGESTQLSEAYAEAEQSSTASEKISQIRQVDPVTIEDQEIVTAAEGNRSDEAEAVMDEKKMTASAENAGSQPYYEPSELRQLHQALQTVWQLQEDQIVLYWER